MLHQHWFQPCGDTNILTQFSTGPWTPTGSFCPGWTGPWMEKGQPASRASDLSHRHNDHFDVTCLSVCLSVSPIFLFISRFLYLSYIFIYLLVLYPLSFYSPPSLTVSLSLSLSLSARLWDWVHGEDWFFLTCEYLLLPGLKKKVAMIFLELELDT